VGAWLERLGVGFPIVQAGMGGGLARHRLAAEVSQAGGLGTIGMLSPGALAAELTRARALTARPLAVNLIVPLARRAHWREAAAADVVFTHWGRPRRRTAGTWVHQCGSVSEARRAHAAGADAVIAQGREAGGHTRASLGAEDLLERIRAALPAGFPVLMAGGVANAGDVSRALSAGAEAAVLGTRFLLTPESRAHPGYRQRLREGQRTLLTELFGTGWPAAPHRVLPNAATDRWLGVDPRGPLAVRALNRLSAPLGRLSLPDTTAHQRPGLPLLTPSPPTDERAASLLDSGPLYAGESVARLSDVRPAAELVGALTP